MARSRSFDGAFKDLPVSTQRALSVDRSYYKDAACRTASNTPKMAWLAESGRRYTLGGHSYRGEKLIELAMLGCSACPVQWRCAAAAIEADERAGIWGDTLDNIRWLGSRAGHINELALAESTGVSVQRTISMLRTVLT